LALTLIELSGTPSNRR
jgi:hypothetical protein